MSHYTPQHRKCGPNWYDVAALAICVLLAAVAVVLWVSRDDDPGGMLTPVQISQIRQDRAGLIQDRSSWEEWSAIHATTRDRADSQ